MVAMRGPKRKPGVIFSLAEFSLLLGEGRDKSSLPLGGGPGRGS
jgi:hypothetical protein